MQFGAVEQFPLDGFSGFQANGCGQGEGKTDIEAGLLSPRTNRLDFQGIGDLHFFHFFVATYKLVYNLAAMSATIIPFELHLPLSLPTIEGNVDYLDLRHQLVRIHQLLIDSGLETSLVEAALARWLGKTSGAPSAEA